MATTRLPELEFDLGYEGHQRRQVRLGLSMSPAQRLDWLEAKLVEMRGLLGIARSKGSPEPSQIASGPAVPQKTAKAIR